MIFEEERIITDTRKLLSMMSMGKMKDVVSSIGAIVIAFSDNLGIEDKAKLMLAQSIIATLDVSYKRDILRSSMEKEKDNNEGS